MILVLVEIDADGATVVSRETLTFARGLAEAAGGLPVDAVVVGPVAGSGEADAWTGLLAHLAEQGVRRVHHAGAETAGEPGTDRLAAYSAAAWAASLVQVARAEPVRAVLAAGTPRGSEVLAHTAVRLGAAMAANVVGVESTDPLMVTRQVVGGGVLEQMALADPVGVLTVAGHACDPQPADSQSTPEVVPYAPELSDADLVARVVRTEEAAPDESAALTSARVVVGAGRGAGSADGFKELLALTELLGGVLGVSRVVTSLGWRPHHEQVGQTGSRISPDLYVACGISGAIQHWAGCQSAKTILAINTDADAPMVTRAHYAVVGDLHEVVPAVNDELRRRADATSN